MINNYLHLKYIQPIYMKIHVGRNEISLYVIASNYLKWVSFLSELNSILGDIAKNISLRNEISHQQRWGLSNKPPEFQHLHSKPFEVICVLSW